MLVLKIGILTFGVITTIAFATLLIALLITPDSNC